MQTVFSHIIRKRFSNEYENVATEALAYILESSDGAHAGLMALLREAIPDLSPLSLLTQQPEGNGRPDMRGSDETGLRVYVEAKFWAGLTERQPVAYLHALESCRQPTLLLFVAPEERVPGLWRELTNRVEATGVILQEWGTIRHPAIVHAASTPSGPRLALTTWSRLIDQLVTSAAGELEALADLHQLNALCNAAESESFLPFEPEQLTDLRTPALLMQLNMTWQVAVAAGVAQGVLYTGGLQPQASAERVGRYARLAGESGIGVWLGLHLELWRLHGIPLWLVFSSTDFGRASEVRPLLAAWARAHGRQTVTHGSDLALGLSVPTGEERDAVARSLVHQLTEVAEALASLTGP